MKKFLLGLLVGLILTILTGVIVVFSAIRFGEPKPTIADGSTMLLKLQGDVPERPGVDLPLPFFGRQAPLTVRDTWSVLRNAATDSRIKGILLMPYGASMGWAKMEEIRQDILAFKKSGKPVIAFLRNPRTPDYYLATAADKIYMSPEDVLDMKGLRAELMFFKNTLNKLGAEVEVMHVGKYKDAGDMFTQTAATPETREVMNSVLDTVYGNLVTVVAQSRKKSADDIRKTIDDGPFIGKKALNYGLIDGLKYEDEVYTEMKEKFGQKELKRVTQREYAKALPTSGDKRKTIALVVGEGDIVRGSETSSDGISGEENIGAFPFIKLLRTVAADDSVKGVILRVDSPGGDAIASDDILREVKLLSQKKPLVVSMSNVAASGGYYISMTGDPIIAYPNTYTGSIGVLFGKVNLRGLYDKIGVTKDIMMRGQNADIDTDYHPLSDAGRQKLREGLDEVYTTFVGKAAAARKKKYDDVEPLAQGRVWMGSQAKDHGLIDELGGLDKAIELVKKKANIGPDEKIRLMPYPGPKSLLDEFVKSRSDSSTETLMFTKLRQLIGFDIRTLSPGGLMRIMPYSIRVE